MKSKSRKRRILRIAGWMGAAVLALLALALIFQGPLLRSLVLPGVEEELSRALGLDVRIGGASIDLRGLVTITDLEASGPEPATGVRAVSLKRAVVSFSPRALLGGRGLSIGKVRLEAPRVDLDLNRDPMFPDILGGSAPEAPGDPDAASLPDIEVVSGGIRLSHGEETLELGGVDFTLGRGKATLSMASAGGSWTLPRPAALEMPLSLEARLAEGPEPWREILIERLSLGTRELLLGFRVRVEPGGEVLLEGGLPGLNARMIAG
ncbi:MAG TPA: hypothetical protein VMT52_01300, partial [Planctomycetota bacterium]|nr:hypothetical protein [Planctomycetota bacterium]